MTTLFLVAIVWSLLGIAGWGVMLWQTRGVPIDGRCVLMLVTAVFIGPIALLDSLLHMKRSR